MPTVSPWWAWVKAWPPAWGSTIRQPWCCLLLVAVTVSATVITVGAIPFVGLVIPNLVALRYGDNLARTLPIVALGGACLLLVCDIIGRLIIYPFEVPIGLTAGSVGGVLFLALIIWRHR